MNANLKGLNHLSADIMAVLTKYEDDKAAGRIIFGESGFADTYPGHDKAHASLVDHIRTHTRLAG